jgi:hypothetical protein
MTDSLQEVMHRVHSFKPAAHSRQIHAAAGICHDFPRTCQRGIILVLT